MPQSRSRSQSPRYDEDSRSRYSHRTYDDNHSQRPRRREGGFRWKEKRRDDGEPRNENGVGLERGYRVRDRLRSPRRDRSKERCGNDREGSTKSEAAPQNEDVKERKIEKMEKKERKERKSKSKSSIPKEPMIVVNVNDRLGTKAAIPCLASDPIRLFKVFVAARIGREPHEILIKRQGERPFKDQLTLEDYGVSNGVQLDLEVDTGD